MGNTAPSINKSTRELYFDILDVLCNRFNGLSPFEVNKTELGEVFDLYIDCIIHDQREKTNKETNNSQDVWVTSKNATWH